MQSIQEMMQMLREMQAHMDQLRGRIEESTRRSIYNTAEVDRYHELEEERSQLEKAIELSLQEERKKKAEKDRARVLGNSKRAPIVLDEDEQEAILNESYNDEEMRIAIAESLKSPKRIPIQETQLPTPQDDDEIQKFIMESIREEVAEKEKKQTHQEQILEDGFEDMDMEDDLEFTKAMTASIQDSERALREQEAIALQKALEAEEREKERKRMEREREIARKLERERIEKEKAEKERFLREQRDIELEDQELEEVMKRSLAEAAKDEERRQRQKLQEEQEKEFQESLRKDRQREEAKRQEELEAQQKRQEQEEREELEKALEFSKELTRNQMITKLEASLPPQPTTSIGVTDIAIRMPDGSRKFLASDRLQVLKDFVDLHGYKTLDSYSRNQYELATSFPSKPIRDLSQSFEEAGLFPRALVNVQSRT